MADIDLKTETPDTSLPTTGFLFGADSQAAASPSVYSTQTVATTLLGSTTLTGATVTTSSPVIDAAQTWNAGGVTFTGLRFNATDTASAAASLLMDLQVGGSSRFAFRKDGAIFGPSSTASVGLNSSGASLTMYSDGIFINTSANVRIGASRSLGFGTSGDGDALIRRRGAANLALGAGDAASPQAQTLSVQSVVAGTSNIAGQPFTITGSQGTGTGAGGSIIFQVAPAGSSGTAQNALATFLEATSARAFNLYNTTDVTTNFERGKIAWESNVLRIGTEKGGTGTARALEFQTDGTTRLTINSNGGFTLADAQDIAIGSTTGTKIGTATTQRIGFFNKTPVVQPTAVADATDAATVITQLNALLSRMRDLGLIAT